MPLGWDIVMQGLTSSRQYILFKENNHTVSVVHLTYLSGFESKPGSDRSTALC
jgi:hypothetical protein